MAAGQVLPRQVRRRRLVRLHRKTRQLRPVLLLRLVCLSSGVVRVIVPADYPSFIRAGFSVILHMGLSVIL